MRGFHGLIVLSCDAEARSELSCVNATTSTELVCPSSFCSSGLHTAGVMGHLRNHDGIRPYTFLTTLACGAKIIVEEYLEGRKVDNISVTKDNSPRVFKKGYSMN